MNDPPHRVENELKCALAIAPGILFVLCRHHEFILGEMYSTEYYRAEYRQLEVISYDSSGVAFPIEAPAGIRSGPLLFLFILSARTTP